MEYPMWHERFCKSSNLLGEAITEMEQAAYEDGHNPKFKKFAEGMRKLRERMFKQWERNCKRCEKKGGR